MTVLGMNNHGYHELCCDVKIDVLMNNRLDQTVWNILIEISFSDEHWVKTDGYSNHQIIDRWIAFFFSLRATLNIKDTRHSIVLNKE